MGNGNLKANLQVKTETAILKKKEREEKERQVAYEVIEKRCHDSAEQGIDFVAIAYPIKLPETIVIASGIMQFAKDNRLLVIKKTSCQVTITWNITLKNRIKDMYYRLTIK